MTILGLIDTGLAPELLAAGARTLGGTSDPHGHGGAVSRILASRVPATALLCAPVFDPRGVTTPLAVAEAVDSLVAGGAATILMALGLAHDRPVLRDACHRAAARGVVLVASAPARGGPCFPAAYAEVISVCGDARCAPDELSWLGGEPALFGAHVGALATDGPRFRGASMGAAWFAAHCHALLSPTSDRAGLVEALRNRCVYFGRERIVPPAP